MDFTRKFSVHCFSERGSLKLAWYFRLLGSLILAYPVLWQIFGYFRSAQKFYNFPTWVPLVVFKGFPGGFSESTLYIRLIVSFLTSKYPLRLKLLKVYLKARRQFSLSPILGATMAVALFLPLPWKNKGAKVDSSLLIRHQDSSMPSTISHE